MAMFGARKISALITAVLVNVVALAGATLAQTRDEALAEARRLNDEVVRLYGKGKYAEATERAQRALALREQALPAGHPDIATSLNNLAQLYTDQGRLAEAEPLLKRALALREQALPAGHPDIATSLNNLAELYRGQGRLAEAEPLLKRALALFEQALPAGHPDIATSLNNLAWLALARRDFDGAAAAWQRATEILQDRAARGLASASAGLAKGETRRLDWFFSGLVKTTQRLAATGRQPEATAAAQMFETAQWGQSSEAAAALAQMAARSAAGSPELAGLVRERQDLVGEWQIKDKRLIAAKSQPGAQRNAAAETELSARLAAIDTRLADIDARLAKDFPEYAALASPKPLSVTDAQASLRDDEALVAFLDTGSNWAPVLPEETFVWVVTKTNVRWLRSDLGTAALNRAVAALRCGLDRTAWYGEGALTCADLLKLPLDKFPGENDPLPFDAARAQALYQSLLGGAADLIKGKHLLVVPSGALTKLPFQVLVTQKPDPTTPLKDVRWLARDHALTVLPSVASLKALRRDAKPSGAERPMIGFGNPLLDGDQAHPKYGAWYKTQAQLARATTACRPTTFERVASLFGLRGGVSPVATRGGLADLAHLKVQTPLPETADELCAVARDLGADVREIRLGANATETEIKRLSAAGDLAGFRIVHFATHGALAGQLSGTNEPGLILSPPDTPTADDDGYLSGSEIAALRLDADWVILSACNTAGGSDDNANAEALGGVARVFFYAGARALLVSHWAVDSDATVGLITRAVKAISGRDAVGRAEALRRAMLDMIDNGKPQQAHPAYWAPFVVVGEGAAGSNDRALP